MRKIAYALAILTAAFMAQRVWADTVTLDLTDGWGALHQYHYAGTSAVPDDPVTMYLPGAVNAAGPMQLWFASEEDHSPAGNMGIGNTYHWEGAFVPLNVSTLVRYYCSGPLINRGGFYSQNCVLTGEQLTLQIQEVTRRVCNHSGRGQSCHNLWTLLGGVITR